MIRLLCLTLALAWAALFVVACGTDKAECGAVINSGKITGSNFSTNCANDDNGPSGAGTTDRHDTTDNHSTPAPTGG